MKVPPRFEWPVLARRAFGLVLMTALFAFGWGLAPAGAQTVQLSPDDTVLAMHFGRHHRGHRHSHHHGMGRAGNGICPQVRTAPVAPDEFANLKNPLKSTPENLRFGENLFHIQAEPTPCRICHGAEGNGMGMMANGLSAMPRNFTCKETMEPLTDGQLFWVIRNGSGTGMPAYKFLSDLEIWQLILYIRTFTEEE